MTARNLVAMTSLCFATLLTGCQAGPQEKISQELPLLGHRNWIVIADAAYPLQTSPGIETIYTGQNQVQTVRTVLAALDKTRHVKPTIYTDAELKFVDEKAAPGVTAYRAELDKLLAGRPAQTLPHEEIIAKLDKAGATFHILLLKTDMTIPYTSVFLQLECGYWNAESEQKLRAAITSSARSNQP